MCGYDPKMHAIVVHMDPEEYGVDLLLDVLEADVIEARDTLVDADKDKMSDNVGAWLRLRSTQEYRLAALEEFTNRLKKGLEEWNEVRNG